MVASEPVGLETLLRSLLSGQPAPAQQPRQSSLQRDWVGGSTPGSVVRLDPRTLGGGGGAQHESPFPGNELL